MPDMNVILSDRPSWPGANVILSEAKDLVAAVARSFGSTPALDDPQDDSSFSPRERGDGGPTAHDGGP